MYLWDAKGISFTAISFTAVERYIMTGLILAIRREAPRSTRKVSVGMRAALAEWGSMPPKQATISATHPGCLDF
jgi:hypothetical protein